MTISGEIDDDNGQEPGLTKNGAGTLVFSGASAAAANTYTGTTAVNAGTLQLSKLAGVTSVAGPLTIGTGTAGNSGRAKHGASARSPTPPP